MIITFNSYIQWISYINERQLFGNRDDSWLFDLLLPFIRVKFSLFFVDSFVDELYVLFLHFSSLFPLSSLGPKQIKIVKMYYVTGCKKTDEGLTEREINQLHVNLSQNNGILDREVN